MRGLHASGSQCPLGLDRNGGKEGKRGRGEATHDLAHHEVEDPLRGRAQGDAELADARGEHLAEVEPGAGAPGEVVRRGFEVDDGDGGGAGAGDGGGEGVGREEGDDDGRYEHAGAHAGGTAHEGPFAADALDEEGLCGLVSVLGVDGWVLC